LTKITKQVSLITEQINMEEKMKKTFLLLVALVAVVGLFAQAIGSGDFNFNVPTLDNLEARYVSGFEAANWKIDTAIGNWITVNPVLSTLEYGTNRSVTDTPAKITAKVNVGEFTTAQFEDVGFVAKLWVDGDFDEITEKYLQTDHSLGETEYYDLEEALVLQAEDQSILTNIYGGAWILPELINYQIQYDNRLPMGTNIKFTFTITEDI